MGQIILQVKENLVEKPWAGNTLSKLKGVNFKVGESWEISPHPKRPSLVKYGNEILPMSDLFSRDEVSGGFRPLLVKFIDAGEKLSIQVHPSDEDAKMLGENDFGKEEAWIALTEAEIMLGFSKKVTKEEFLEAVKNNSVENLLNYIKCKKFEGYLVPPKTVHAICGGLVYEVSTCSDITYRVYDYGRGRELHLDKALEVINFSASDISKLKFDVLNEDLQGENFVLRIVKKGEIENKTYTFVSCVEGEVKIECEEEVCLSPFTSAFVPNCVESFKILGSGLAILASPMDNYRLFKSI